MDIVLYEDRNLVDKRIVPAIRDIFAFFKNYKNFKYIPYTDFKLVKAKIAIMWGVYCNHKENTLYRKKIKNFQIKNNNKLIIIEVGFIQRHIYYSIGFDNIVGWGGYLEKNITSSDRFNKLNITIKNKNNDENGYILVCGQIPWDTQVQHIDYRKWLNNILFEIRKYTKRQIMFRVHPKLPSTDKMFNMHAKWSTNINNLILSTNADIKNDIQNAYCVLAFNSNSLLDSLIEGIPICCFDNGSMIYDLSNKSINNLNSLYFPDKNKIKTRLNQIGYTQWNSEEIIRGDPFKHLQII
jgi:hypothetical protein